MEVKIARNLLLFFSEFVRGRNYPSPAIWLVPWTGGFLWSCPLTRAEFLRKELCSGFFKHVNIKHVNFHFLTYRHGYHNESEFYYPHKMTNENEKENIGAISNEENQQNVEVFTMANVQNYILTQRAENTAWKTQITTWRLSGLGRYSRQSQATDQGRWMTSFSLIFV